MYRLDHLNGPQRGGHRIVHRRRLEAGSDLSCALWAPLEGLAPRHAVFEDDGERVRVRALDGAPLRINGREVAEAELREGDLVEIGPLQVRFSRRRWRARDVRRALPAVAGLLGLVFAASYWALRQRRSAQQLLETPPPPPTAGGPVTPSLRIMETVAERLETTESERLERVAAELEREREQAPTAPAAPPDPGEDIETRRRNAEAALAAARARADEGRLSEAEMILARLQAASPDFLEAWAERARIQERQGRIEDALGQWRRILDAGPNSSLHPVAAAETLRLSRLLAAAKPAPPPPAATPTPTPPVSATPAPAPPMSAPGTPVLTPPTRHAPRLRFIAVEPTRFPATAEYEEMRILRLVVRAEPPLAGEELAAARVEVTFYDILEGGQTAVPTRVRVGSGPFHLRQLPRDERGDWIVTATYTVPRGWRERERRATGRAYRYHGFLAQAFIGAEWQTAEARPRQLAERVNGRTRANSP